jgi:hypothetical protein
VALDNFRKQKITWDKANGLILEKISANSSDEAGRSLQVTVTDNHVVTDVTGYALHLYWITRDKAHTGLDVFTLTDAANGVFELYYTTGMLSNVGDLSANLVLADINGRVISNGFTITVKPGIDATAVQSSDSFSSLTTALAEISDLETTYAPRLTSLETAINGALIDAYGTTHLSIDDRMAASEETAVTSLNIKAFGAVGDGETDDSDAIQSAVDYAYSSGINSVYAPAGVYYLSKAIHTRNDTDWTLKGIEFYGAGMSTVFQRVRNSERSATLRSWFQASSDNATKAEESCFAVHSMRNIFRNFTVSWTKVGIYLGQDNRSPLARNVVNFNRFDNIFIQYIGTGIVMRPGISCYYNTFHATQIAEGNIGIDMAEEYTYDPTFMTVSNRNSFTQCEINKVWLGVYLLNGDTNFFDNVHFENIEDLGADGTWGPQPPQLVDGVRTALHIGYALNNFTNCTIEFCDRDLYDDGYGNNYINNNINLLDGKFLRGPNSRIGSFIGVGSDGVSDAFNKGGLLFQHENKATDLGALDAKYPKWSTIATEPFLLAKDMYDIEDIGTRYKHYDGKEYAIESNMTPTPVSINAVDSVFYHKKIGGINQVILRTYVQMAAGDINAPIVLSLPKAPNTKLSSYAFNQPMGFPALVANAFAIARFNLDGKLVVIPPAGGWSTTTDRTAIEVQITYF